SWHWLSSPPKSLSGPEPFLSRLDADHQRFFHEQVKYYIDHDIIEEISPATLATFGSDFNFLKWFGAAQKSKSTPSRPIWDFRPINACIYHGPMRQQLLSQVQQLLRIGTTIISIDISKAFLAISLEKPLRRYTLFRYCSKIYQHKRLGFVASCAPHALEICLRLLFRSANLYERLREGGWQLIQYMDDLFLVMISPTPVMSPSEVTNLILSVLRQACFEVQPRKTCFLTTRSSEKLLIHKKDEVKPMKKALLVGILYSKEGNTVSYPTVQLQVPDATEGPLTRRRLLGVVSKLRDPLLIRPLCNVVTNHLKHIIGSMTYTWDEQFSERDTSLWIDRLSRLEDFNKMESSSAAGCLSPSGIL
ncbi:hypothetical protein FOZ63_011709, partial [Perkinsus olseni]